MTPAVKKINRIKLVLKGFLLVFIHSNFEVFFPMSETQFSKLYSHFANHLTKVSNSEDFNGLILEKLIKKIFT